MEIGARRSDRRRRGRAISKDSTAVPITPSRRISPGAGYLIAILSVGAATLFQQITDPIVGATPLVLLGAVVVSAFFGGYGPGLLATMLTAPLVAVGMVKEGAPIPLDEVSWVRVALFAVEGALVSLLGGRRITTERTLRAQREWLEVTLASIGDGVVATDDAGRVVSLNQVAESLTGYRKDEAVGASIDGIIRIIDERSRLPVSNPIEPVLREGLVVGSAAHRLLVARDGTEIPIDESAAPIRDANDRMIGAVLVFRDTSERKEAEARREAIVASALDGIISLDHRGHVIEFNPAAERIFGFARDEVLGRELSQLIMPQRFREAHCRALASYPDPRGSAVLGKRVEMAALRADGSEFPCELTVVRMPLSGSPVFTGFVRDLTQREQARQAVRESEERFRIMADVAPVMVWMAGVDQQCDWFNKAWLDYVGRTMEQELGSGWTEDIHPEDSAEALIAYGEAFARREPFVIEYRLRRADGVYRWVLDHGVPRFDAEARFVGYIGSCIDIDDQKRLRQSLVQADRRKDEFLAVLGHELRNPLSVVQNAMQVLAAEGHSPELRERVIPMVQRQVQQMVRLLNDLLDISRISRGRIELQRRPVELGKLVACAVDAVRERIEQREHRLEIELSAEPLWLDVDETRIEQVLVNLLVNAAQYTEPGGTIWISAEREASGAVVRVRDSGTGLAPDMLDRVFEPFVRHGATGHSGLGIGLALVRQLVELHGGKVSAWSAGPDRGSEFVVRLPAASAAVQPAPGTMAAEGQTASRPRRILVVDDVEPAAKLLSMLFEGKGHEVRVANDGPAALALAASFLPEIVFLDLGMPGMDGFEVARRLRRDTGRPMRLVALTGFGHEEARRRVVESGFDEYVLKGTTDEELSRLVERC